MFKKLLLIGLIMTIAIGFLGFKNPNANLTFINNKTNVIFTNAITINTPGQKVNFLNGTITVNYTTQYTPPNVGNIHQVHNHLWKFTTFMDIQSTYNSPLFLKNYYIKAVDKNPTNLTVSELITQPILTNATTFIASGIGFSTTPNGTTSHTTFTAINVPILKNVSFYRSLQGNYLILVPGHNKILISGTVMGGVNYTYNFTVSSANAVIPNSTTLLGNTIYISNYSLTSSIVSTYNILKITNMPITTLNIDPKSDPPADINVWFNYSMTNTDPTNAINKGQVINFTFNALQFAQYTNNGMTNWAIFNVVTGNIMFGYMDGNSPLINKNPGNFLQTSAINTANSVTIWIVLDNSCAASATCANVFAFGLYNWQTNSMNGNDIGESSVLTCGPSSDLRTCGTYGKFDNGANVFPFYSNFSSSGLANWNTLGQSGISSVVANSLIIFTATDAASSFELETKTSYANALKVQALGNNFGRPGSVGSPSIGIQESTSTTSCGTGAPGYGAGYGVLSQAGSYPFDKWVACAGTTLSTLAAPTFTGNSILINMTWEGTGNEIGSIDGSGATSVDSAITLQPKIFGAIGEAGGSHAATANFIWFRLVPQMFRRPTFTNTIVQGTTTCTFVVNSAIVNFGSISTGTNTIGTVNGLKIDLAGSLTSNILVSGSNWIYLSNSFYVTNTVWSQSNSVSNPTSGNTLWNPVGNTLCKDGVSGCGYATTGVGFTTSNVEVKLTQLSVDTLVPVNLISGNFIYIGASVPSGQASSTSSFYSQTFNVITKC